MTISRRHFGLRDIRRETAPAKPAGFEIDTQNLPASRLTWKQIRTALVITGSIFIVSTRLIWSYYQYQVLENASPDVRKACAGASLRSPSRDAYYYCVERVEAGGEP